MDQILYQWEMNPTTWVYLSSLLMIAIYFKFSRFWSVRNLDLIGLIALAPGLLLVVAGKDLHLRAENGQPARTAAAEAQRPATAGDAGAANATLSEGRSIERWGFVWLFIAGLLFLIRLLCDPMMVRRPLLEPNLSTGGLTFSACALLVFLMANVVTGKLSADESREQAGPVAAEAGRNGGTDDEGNVARLGPAYPLLRYLPSIPSRAWLKFADPPSKAASNIERTATSRTMAILAHLAIVIGIVLIGYRHFDNIRTGIAVATLYLLLPVTAQMVGRLEYVLPAALLVWTVEAYRRPLVAGILLGLAAGVVPFFLFLLPLWVSFYWQRGLLRFVLGVTSMLLLMLGILVFTPDDLGRFLAQLQLMFSSQHVDGFWKFFEPAFRWPIFAALVALSGSLALWPPQKNLGTLLSCSAAVMLATQFWHGQEGGLAMAWYMPLLLLTVFRPNLEHRVASSSLAENRWFARLKAQWGRLEKAA